MKLAILLSLTAGFILGQFSYRGIHSCETDCNKEVILLKTQSRQKDSLLYLCLNDYPFHIRVMAGIEKDSMVLKYQKWNPANKNKKQ